MKGAKFLLPALAKTLVLPPLLVFLFLRSLPSTSVVLSAIAYASSFPVLFILRSILSAKLSARDARRLGAVDIPRVRGRWPLNLDVLWDWAKSGSEEEVGRMMVLMERRYGQTYNTRVFGEDQIMTTDPRVFRHVLVGDFDSFVKGQKFKDRAQGFLGDGIFNSDGELWRHHRSLLRPFFHPNLIRPSRFLNLVNNYISSIRCGKAFDIQAELGQLSLQISIMWLCGTDLTMELGTGKIAEWQEAHSKLGQAMSDAQRTVGRRMKIGTLWPLFELTDDPLKKPMKTIRAFFDPIISQAIDRKQRNLESKDGSAHLLIDRLVHAIDNRQEIEDQLINILLASRDTLASLLTFCVYALVLHPEIAFKVHGEVISICGLQGEITKDHIRDLRYNRAFINEVLRLFPPTPLNIRRTLGPSVLPTPVPSYMPANTSIILATILMQRDPKVWGEDAQAFQPNRWLNGSGVQREGFTSWNIGPRICLGQPLALTAAHTFLAYFSRHFGTSEATLRLAPEAQTLRSAIPESWKSEDGSDGRLRGRRDKVWIVADVVLAVKGGLWVVAEPNGKDEEV
ncbi:hypothetical protein IAR50_000585 [Cryptococcus sp. DSM 104548]